MKHNKLVHIFAVALMLAMALPAVASPRGAKTPKAVVKSHFAIVGGEILNGTTLAPGDYNVIATDSTVSFFRGSKLVAQAPIQWKDNNQKVDQNAILVDTGKIQGVRFKGKNRSVVVQ